MLFRSDPVTGKEFHRYPSLAEIAKRYGVSSNLVWVYAHKEKCFERRKEAHAKAQARFEHKLIEKVADARALATADVVGIVDQFLRGFEKELSEGRVKTDSAADFDRLIRLRELLRGGADSRQEIMGGLTLEAIQNRHRQLRVQIDGVTPELAGTTSQVGTEDDLGGRAEHTR